jgi:hypothetical protein
MRKSLHIVLAGSLWLALPAGAGAQTVTYSIDGGKLLEVLKKTVVIPAVGAYDCALELLD